jgi:hypothetical protein
MNKRLAYVTVKALKDHGRYGGDETECAAKYTNDPFEAQLIGLAMYWSNDLLDAAFEALGIPMKEGAFNSTTHDEWHKWFEKTVDELKLEE